MLNNYSLIAGSIKTLIREWLLMGYFFKDYGKQRGNRTYKRSELSE